MSVVVTTDTEVHPLNAAWFDVWEEKIAYGEDWAGNYAAALDSGDLETARWFSRSSLPSRRKIRCLTTKAINRGAPAISDDDPRLIALTSREKAVYNSIAESDGRFRHMWTAEVIRRKADVAARRRNTPHTDKPRKRAAPPVETPPPLVRSVEETLEQRKVKNDLIEAWELLAAFGPGDREAWALLRSKAVAAGDDATATLAKARLKVLRNGRGADPDIAKMIEAAEATGAQMMARRQRNYAAEYARRVQRAEARGLSRSQAAGHPRTGERRASEALSAPEWTTTIFGDPSHVVTVATGYREAQRAGRYMELTRKLNQGEITAGEFRRKVSRMPPIAGVDLLSDPRQVLALVVLTDKSQFLFESKGTPARRKRGKQ